MGRRLAPLLSLRQQAGGKRDQRRTRKRNDPWNSHLEESGGNTVPGSSWPSGNTNFFTCIPLSPFLAGAPITVTWSPGLRVLLLQPLLDRRFGLGSSPCHSMALPLSSFTVKVSNVCGLTYWSSVTVARMVTIFVMSYSEAPWCAHRGIEIRNIPIVKATRVICSLVTRPPSWISAGLALI